ncbi:hypothetical protein PM10SUCC1_34390 [Propionigenium maris DSM 9537]|uniref:PLD phosphodiesterase domain-containing protein n=1 Tax=Propionigenium maris DSM 9537 TaxID=1123000 RepID=A0A9W6GPE4_9FUSO|nr:phospholipase D family protein [Propionigenium maris]GLI57925.1 hypothetical protein PM10SUCC1_34390 [Propionigenium maris DSM 9537]
MKIISNNNTLETLLLKLIKKHSEIRISVAWASAKTKIFETLIANKHKLKTSTIGIHFYQTDPEFLEAFVESKDIKMHPWTDGVFHPKVYFFSTDEKWDAIIGSANLTNAAFTKNSELNIHISHESDTDNHLVKKLLENIEGYFKQGETITSDYLTGYKGLWRKNKSHRDKLSGNYGSSQVKKPVLKSEIMKTHWKDYVERVKIDPYHSIDERLYLLRIMRESFLKYKKFSDIPTNIRKLIAGLPDGVHDNWGWFGSMIGAGRFKNRIHNNNKFISEALDYIPLEGDISKSNYLDFITVYKKAFPEGGDGIATVTRLLAMKRPDIFVCIDTRNRVSMCKDFGIKSSLSYNEYWDELITRIQDSLWWSAKERVKDKDKRIWNNRAALLDCIFYDEDA